MNFKKLSPNSEPGTLRPRKGYYISELKQFTDTP
jgi:hypothetical protein